MEARRVPAQLTLALVLAACGGRERREAPPIPPQVDAWAREVLTLKLETVCTDSSTHTDRAVFCTVRPSVMTPAIAALNASITLQLPRTGEPYIDLDWGGGHVEAYGVIIGPAGWSHVADPERREHELRDGVFMYDTRP